MEKIDAEINKNTYEIGRLFYEANKENDNVDAYTKSGWIPINSWMQTRRNYIKKS